MENPEVETIDLHQNLEETILIEAVDLVIFYYILKYVVMWRKFVLVSQKRYMRQRVKKKFSMY